MQAWFRGILSRRETMKQGMYTVFIKRTKEQRLSQLPSNVQTTGNKPEWPSLKAITLLQRVLSSIEQDTDAVSQLSYSIQLLKRDVFDTLKSQIVQEMNTMKQEFTTMSQACISHLKQASTRETTTKSVQTMATSCTEKSIQVGVTSLSFIQVKDASQ